MPARKTTTDLPEHTWLHRRIALPILALLRLGASPERIAWSLAIGIVIGLNPILGSTTVVCLLIALIFRLNLAASQLANHIVYPLQLLLLLPFLHLGTLLFKTSPIPLSPTELLHRARTSPVELSRQLWLWEAHALVVWCVLALITAPAAAAVLTPVLRRLQDRVERPQDPLTLDTSQEIHSSKI